jgi:hypothetical protein
VSLFLRSGGRYAFTVWDPPDKAIGFGIVLQAIQARGDMTVPLPPGPPFFRFSDPAETERTLNAAGFIDVRTSTIPQVWRLDSGDARLDTFRTAAVRTAALLNIQREDALRMICEEIVRRAEEFRRGDVIELPMPAVLAIGAKP